MDSAVSDFCVRRRMDGAIEQGIFRYSTLALNRFPLESKIGN